MIKISNINKYYNKRSNNENHVLKDINLTFSESGFVTILGKSGAGKSTLLHVIGGLDKASGTIQYDDIVVDKYNPKKVDKYRNNNIGCIFQNYNLLPNLTVYENLEVAIRLLEITDRKEINERIDIALTQVGMLKYKRRNAMSLSGGQQQRVAIARALVKGCKIIIADEPTGNLDSANTYEVMNILKAISKTCLVLLITHEVEIATHYSDRLITLVDGKVTNDESFVSSDTLKKDLSNTVYLDEMQYEKKETENIKIDYYHDNAKENISLQIIVKDNCIYLKANSELPIKYNGINSDMKILEHRQEVEEKVDTTYEPKKNIPNKKTFKEKFFGLIRAIRNSDRFFLKRQSIKVLLLIFVFALIGIGLCISMNIFYGAQKVDEESVFNWQLNETVGITNYSEEKGTLPKGDGMDKALIALMAEDSGVYSIEFGNNIPSELRNNLGIKYEITPKAFINYGSIMITNQNMYPENTFSHILQPGEIFISKKTGEEINKSFKQYGKENLDIIGEEIEICSTNVMVRTQFNTTTNNKFKVVGYSSDYSPCIVLNEKDYFEVMYNYLKKDVALAFRDPTYSFFAPDNPTINEYFDNRVPISDVPANSENDGFIDIWVSTAIQDAARVPSTPSVYSYNNIFKLDNNSFVIEGNNSQNYRIRGTIDSATNMVIFDTKIEYNTYVFNNPISRCYPFEMMPELQSGQQPTAKNEIIISEKLSNDFEINQEITICGAPLKIVGFYEDNEEKDYYDYYACAPIANYLMSYNLKSEYYKISNYYYFDDVSLVNVFSTDYEKTLSYFNDMGYHAEITQDYLYDLAQTNNMMAARATIISSIVLMVILIVCIYLLLWSRMSGDIYTIGVYRSLGAKRSMFYRKYIIGGFLLATSSAALSFTIWYIGTVGNVIFFQKAAPLLYYFIGLVGIYVVFIFVSILPVYLLLRKTPTEILKKYDI